MKFYSEIEGTEILWDGQKGLVFIDGVYETDNKKEIALLKKAGYRSDEDGGQTEQTNSEG